MSDQYYHFTVKYDSADPGVYVVKYYQVSDNGTSATVGMQDCMSTFILSPLFHSFSLGFMEEGFG